MNNRMTRRDSLLIDFESEMNIMANGTDEDFDKSYYYMIDTLEIAINTGEKDGSISDKTLKAILKYLEEKSANLRECYYNIVMCFYHNLDLKYLK